MARWLALIIGNTRWHWAWFSESNLRQVWHTPHLSAPQISSVSRLSILGNQVPPPLRDCPVESMDIWAVSVVPQQAKHLEQLATVKWLHNFPLKGIYPTMGLDRVITLL